MAYVTILIYQNLKKHDFCNEMKPKLVVFVWWIGMDSYFDQNLSQNWEHNSDFKERFGEKGIVLYLSINLEVHRSRPQHCIKKNVFCTPSIIPKEE
jgi:hypothetical protein